MITQDLSVPVITIDGWAGSGKGTTRKIVADRLGFNQLDSEVLYCALALMAIRWKISFEEDKIVPLATRLDVRTEGETILLCGNDETESIRSDFVANHTKTVVAMPKVRSAILALQISMRRSPGLVADGRDMGEIFETPHRFFLDASIGVRVQRRMKDFERDHMTRTVSPLKPHPKAWIIDTGFIEPEPVADMIIGYYNKFKDWKSPAT